ncbi:MAG: pyridoxamine 5'-phosphate oxidase family protein [Dehalococcoidia bacterium]|nr:pyridoxamine 5'-phosphate oxidase family protein [Dehalococcoidia bacterium]
MIEISDNISDFLKRPLVGTLATLDSDGSPRTRAIWHDWSEQGLLLFSGSKTRKWQNIVNDARVSLCVDDSAVPYKSVVIDGTAIRREDQPDLLFTVILRMAEKYYGISEGRIFAESYRTIPQDQVALFEIHIDRITDQGF